MDGFQKCTLKRNEDGDPDEFFAKKTGFGVDDMCLLGTLTKTSIVDNLKIRFDGELVYTYVGDIIVSVNPFKNTGCVGKAIRQRYGKLPRNVILLPSKGPPTHILINVAADLRLIQCPPHIYALVDTTYVQMLSEEVSQSILISGESGAGKTEAMKICLTRAHGLEKFIGEVAAMKCKGSEKSKSGTQTSAADVAKRLQQTNPVMEALGNAKTIRNNNSSRFGKHFDVQFTSAGSMVGAFTSSYLLEKPRITVHQNGERNYHIFYMLCKAHAKVRDPVNIGDWEGYKICKQKGTVAEVTTWDDYKEFEDCHDAFLQLGFSEGARSNLYTMLSTCLNLGNLEFVPDDQGSTIKDKQLLSTCAGLICVEPDSLLKAVTNRTIGGGGVIEAMLKPLEPRDAQTACYSLIMHIYSLVFDWCVNRQAAIASDWSRQPEPAPDLGRCVDVINDYIAVRNFAFAVGLLDIFGFENFSSNSFPQLCINFTNESLHNLFIEHVFKLEQEIYVREEVEWKFVDYEDNQHTIDLISARPVCILGLLDESCGLGSAKDENVLSNFNSALTDKKKHKSFIRPKKAADRNFVIDHYAGEVVYTIDGFIEKNMDALSEDITKLLTEEAKLDDLQRVAKRDMEKKAEAEDANANKKKKKGGGGKKRKTVSKTFGDSLNQLMTKLRSTSHHYIRCLKPNQTLQAGDWDADFMVKQLAYSGTLEVTQIRKAGLNVRRPLKHFFLYYKMCADEPAALRAGTLRGRAELLMEQVHVNKDQYRVGKTLIFLANFEIIDALDKIREVKIVEYVIILQSYGRMFPPFRRFRRMRTAATLIQAKWHSRKIFAAYTTVRTATRRVQKAWRRTMLRQASKKVRAMDVPDKTKRQLLIREMQKVQIPTGHGCGVVSAGVIANPATLLVTQHILQEQKTTAMPVPKFTQTYEAWVLAKLPERHALGHFALSHNYTRCWAVLRLGAISLYSTNTSMVPLQYFRLGNAKVELEGTVIHIKRAGGHRDSQRMSIDDGGQDEEEVGPVAAGATNKASSLETSPPPVLRERKGAKGLAGGFTVRKARGKDKVEAANQNAAVRHARHQARGHLHEEMEFMQEGDNERAKKPEDYQTFRGWERFSLPQPDSTYYDLSEEERALDWKDKLETSVVEMEKVEEFKMINPWLPADQKVDPYVTVVLKEGWLRVKELRLHRSEDLETVLSEEVLSPWQLLYFVLGNDNKMVYFTDASKEHEVGSYRICEFMAEEMEGLDDDFDVVDEPRQWLPSWLPGRGTQHKTRSDHMTRNEVIARGQLFYLVKGKQLQMICGSTVHRLASPTPGVIAAWLDALRLCIAISYQLYPIFPPEGTHVYTMDGHHCSVPINATTTAKDVIRHVCRELGVTNEREWGLIDLWDHAGLPGSVMERKVPPEEVLLDQALLYRETGHRKRHGMVHVANRKSYCFVLRRQTSLFPTAPTAKAMELDFGQSLSDVREERFWSEYPQEYFELAALAIFAELSEKRGDIVDHITVEDLQGHEKEFLPASWFDEPDLHMRASRHHMELMPTDGSHVDEIISNPKVVKQLASWRTHIVDCFNSLLVSELVESEEMTPLTLMVWEHRQEHEMSAAAAKELIFNRVRRAPRCFATEFTCELWSGENLDINEEDKFMVTVSINLHGMHICQADEKENLLATFGYLDEIIGWMVINNMLIVNIIFERGRKKLHLISKESAAMKELLRRYARENLAELKQQQEKAQKIAAAYETLRKRSSPEKAQKRAHMAALGRSNSWVEKAEDGKQVLQDQKSHTRFRGRSRKPALLKGKSHKKAPAPERLPPVPAPAQLEDGPVASSVITSL